MGSRTVRQTLNAASRWKKNLYVITVKCALTGVDFTSGLFLGLRGVKLAVNNGRTNALARIVETFTTLPG